MDVTSGLLTVAEFARLPRAFGGKRQELHHGELVELPPVKKLHTQLQKRLVALLEARLQPSEQAADKEFPFRPAAEFEVWIADIAVYQLALWEQTADDDYYLGVPEMVIEVLSPSNSVKEMSEREQVCLEHGGREFWLVDPEARSVNVVRMSGETTVHALSDVIYSDLLSKPLAVRDIFVPDQPVAAK